jgi:hypothetical protein
MNGRTAIASIILGLITTALAELLGISQRINPIDTGILNNVWVRSAGITIIVALVIYAVLSYLNKRRKKFRKQNAPAGFVSNSEPRTVYAECEIEKFGVKWRGKYGTFRNRSYTSRDDAYVYVEGPFCPDDDRKLKSRTVPKWFVFDQKAWVCPHCDKKYPRSTTHYLTEDNVVKDEMERVFEQQRAQQQSRR